MHMARALQLKALSLNCVVTCESAQEKDKLGLDTICSWLRDIHAVRLFMTG